MALPVTIPNTFANATASIPLSQLDTNFNTLANAVNGISDGSETLANASVTVLTAGTVDINGGAIDGTTVGTSNAAAGSFTTLNTSGAVVFNDAGADVDFRVEGDTEANLLFVDASTDRVGMGTNTPAEELHVYRGSATGTYLRAENTVGILYAGVRDTGVAWVATESDDPLAFGTNGSERMRINSSGNVGIGVTPEVWDTNFKALQIGATAALVYFPSSDQTVLYNNTYYSSGDKRLIDGSASYYSQGSGAHFWGIAGSGLADSAISFTSAMTLDASGRLLVGTTSTDPISSNVNGVAFSPTTSYSELIHKVNGTPMAVGRSGTGSGLIDFYFNSGSVVLTGSITTNGTTTAYNTSSDYRLKENVAPMTGALAKVLELNPVTYTWKVNGSAGQGFIAHELQEVAPYAVSGEKDGEEMQGVDYGKITPLLTAALQEAITEIQSLKARVAELEAK